MAKNEIQIDTGKINIDEEDFDLQIVKAVTLKEYLATHPYKGFKPQPRYYKFGDYLTYFAKPDRCTGKTIDEFLTVYRSIEDDSIVGVKIKNLKKFIEQDLGE